MLDRSHELATTARLHATAKTETGFAGFDQRFHAVIARLTGGLSPLALSQAYTDWAGHLLMSPDKQAELTRSAAAASASFLSYCLRRGGASVAPYASNRCPRTSGLAERNGGDGPSISSPRVFCLPSSGGMRQHPVCPASPSTMRT